jgi:2-isopropylmalate synthase
VALNKEYPMSTDHVSAAGTSRAVSLALDPADLLSREDLAREIEFFRSLISGAAEPDSTSDLAATEIESQGGITLVSLQATAGTSGLATALVTLKGPMGTRHETASGSGPVNALCKAIDRITGFNGNLAYYSARAASRGRDAIVGVFLRAEFGASSYLGMAADTDIIHASARAYLSAVNSNLRADAARIEMLEFEALTARAGDSGQVDEWV